MIFIACEDKQGKFKGFVRGETFKACLHDAERLGGKPFGHAIITNYSRPLNFKLELRRSLKTRKIGEVKK